MKNIYRHSIIARIDFERDYDEKNPASLLEILQEIDTARNALVDLGADLTKDAGRACSVRE